MTGTIAISQLTTPPEKHEFKTAKYFADSGKNIVFLRPSSIPKMHRPDILMDGIEWEIKCPKGNSKRTIENNIATAEKQSAFIILDLRRVSLPEKYCLSQIEINFKTRSRVKRILVIAKVGKLLEYPPKI